MEPKSELKTRGANFAKFDSRPYGSSIFEVPGWSVIDGKLTQTEHETETATQEPKKREKLAKIGPR